MTHRPPPLDQRPLRRTADLTAVWRTVLNTEPMRLRTLWMLFLDDAGRPVGPLLVMEDLPDGPYDLARGDVIAWCEDLLEGPGAATSVAFLLARPGGDPWTVSDWAWGRFLTATLDDLRGPRWPIHWAHRKRVEEFRPR